MSDSLPTLLRKGFIIPPKGSSESEKKIIANTISVDYVIQFIGKRVMRRGSVAEKPTQYGDMVVLIKSDTGSGKSTVLPAKLYTEFNDRDRGNIIVTQPRVLTAMDIPSIIVPFNSQLKLGKNIGYNTGVFKLPPLEMGITFVTVGILAQELIMNSDDDFLKKYKFIVIDEVHERDIETDKCLFLLKKFLQANFKKPGCPLVILMSATFNEVIFTRYFDVPKKNYIQVIGSTFPIQDNFSDYSISNYIDYACLKAQQLHLDNLADIDNGDGVRDIIIFVKDTNIGKKMSQKLHEFNANILSGTEDSVIAYKDELPEQLQKHYKTGGATSIKHYYILPILLNKQNFEMGGLEYQNLFSQLEAIHVPLWKKGAVDITTEPHDYVIPSRRIIISTNIAETGVTIATLKYCIDTGYNLSAGFYSEYGCQALISKYISQSSAIQRRGRVGRKAPGYWYPCYTKETYNLIVGEQISAIISSDTTSTLLSMLIKEKDVEILSVYDPKQIQRGEAFQMEKNVSTDWYYLDNDLATNISAIDIIELPSIQSLAYSVEKLYMLGYMDVEYDITILGYYANKFRFISLDSIRMIFAGYHYGANILYLITIAAFIYVSKRLVFETKFEFDTDSSDELISCILVWDKLQKYISDRLEKGLVGLTDLDDWCQKNMIKYDGILNVIAMRDDIIENMINIGLNPYYTQTGVRDYNLTKTLKSSDDGFTEIKKIKKCVYAGYKLNLLVHDGNVYKSAHKHVNVKVKSKILGDYPKYVLVNSYMLSQKFDSSQYQFESSGFVSVLDGYVDVDLQFYYH
jgi:HrpA-like RNA helicase